MKKPITWAYGVTTVRERIDNHLLARTLKSLAVAGFNRPRLFIDGATLEQSAAIATQFDLPVTVRTPAISLSGNWILALWELYSRDPTAHRFALFQDDIVVSRNLRPYLESCPYEPKSYYNLITYRQNEEIADGRTGWYHSNQRGRGAQGLVFDREAVIALLGSRHLPDRLQDARRGPQAIDGGICTALHQQGFKEWVHYPSLIAHTSESSTVGHGPQKTGDSFPGEEYDLMQEQPSDDTQGIPHYRQTLQANDIQSLVGNEPLILEIGCHEGTDTVKFLAAMPGAAIDCFDPEQRALARFREKGLDKDPRVRLFELAIADVDGPKEFHASTGKAGRMADWDYSGSLCEPTGHLTRSPEIGFKPPEPVECVTLDSWYTKPIDTTAAATKEWRTYAPAVASMRPTIDFIWADVQGSQRLVIDGGKEALANTRYLYIESHDPPAYAGEPTQAELVDLLAEWFEPIGIYARENILFKSKGKA